MKNYAGTDRDRWMHWLSKVMQKKLLHEFIELIPAEKGEPRLPGAPKSVSLLPTTFYTTMFLYFIRRQDFASVESMVKQTPEHVTNANALIQELKPYLERESTGNDQHLLDSLFSLYK